MAIYKKIAPNIHRLLIDNPDTKGGAFTWYNIPNARKKEIEYLRKNFDFSLAHLQASSIKATAQRPAIEEMDDYLFIILHFPVFDKDGNITSEEIEFFVGDDFLVTLHNNKIKTINEFFSLCKKDGESLQSHKFESSAVLLFEILEKLMLNTFKLLDKNSETIIDLEELIFNQKSKRAVSKILSLRRNIINTRRIMQNHKNIIKKLINFQTGNAPVDVINNNYKILLEHSKRFWENLENQKEMIEVLNSTNESLLNYRISDIMKTLTIFSVIVFPLTLLAAIFGMNTENGMPFVNMENGFWYVMGIMLIGCLGMLIIFAKKKWL